MEEDLKTTAAIPEMDTDEICNGLAALTSQCELIESLNRVVTLSFLHEHWTAGHHVKLVCVTCGLENVSYITCLNEESTGQANGGIEEHAVHVDKMEVSVPEVANDDLLEVDNAHVFKTTVSDDQLIANQKTSNNISPTRANRCKRQGKQSRKSKPVADKNDSNCVETVGTHLPKYAEYRVGTAYDNITTSNVTGKLNGGDHNCMSAEPVDNNDEALEPESTPREEIIGYYCDKCPFYCNNLKTLSSHARMHPVEKPYICCECHKAFATSTLLKAHVQSHSEEKFVCAVCDMGTKTLSSIKTHLHVHTFAGPLSCSTCGFTCDSKPELYNHRKRHRRKQRFQCSVCLKKFTEARYLNEHIRIHTGERPFSCNTCDKTFRTKQDVTRHERRRHALVRVKSFQCTYCLKTFLSGEGLETHMRLHTGEKPFKCWECGESFCYRVDLRRHKRLSGHLKPEDSNKLYVCSECGLSFDYPSLLKYHMTVHTNEKPFVCQTCGKRFRLVHSMYRHMMYHSNEKPYSCINCNKSFKVIYDMKKHKCFNQHQKLQSSESDKKAVDERSDLSAKSTQLIIKCQECGQGFVKYAMYRQHLQTTGHLSTDKPFVCECGKAFESSFKLKQHAVMHSHEKPFVCGHCGRGFNAQNRLREHLADHSGEKPYQCSQCDRTFFYEHLLKKHAVMHSTERPYRCCDCGKSFARPEGLKDHMIVHTNERPFPCRVCSKPFKTKENLRQHLRSHLSHPSTRPLAENLVKYSTLKTHLISNKRQAKSYVEASVINIDDGDSDCLRVELVSDSCIKTELADDITVISA